MLDRAFGVRLDKVRLGATPIEVRPEGYRKYRGRAAFGDVVLEYPEFGRNEFVPAAVALSDEAIASTRGVPFTIFHPDDLLSSMDEESIKRHTVGSVVDAWADWESDPPALIVDVMVLTASAQEAVESGRCCELSLGYSTEDEMRSGEFMGKPFQVVQVKRRSNHLSGVDRARSTSRDGRRARLDEARQDSSLDPGEATGRLVVEFGAGRSWAQVDDRPGLTVSPTPEVWNNALSTARTILVPADSLQVPPLTAGMRRADAASPHPLPPSVPAVARFDAESLPDAPVDHPAAAARIVEYGRGVAAWHGYSEPASREWIAFWPRDAATPGLLWTRRDNTTGATLGAPMKLAARAPYARTDTRGRMKDDNATTEADPTTETRLDADAPPPEKKDADEAEMLAAAAVAASLSPEDAEILKTLSPEGQALLMTALKQVKAEAAEQAVMAEEVEVEVEDATVPNAPQALTADAVQKMIDAAVAKMSAPKKDAAPPAVKSQPAIVRPETPALDADAVAALAAKKVRESARLDAEFVGRARKDGHVAAEASVQEAAVSMLAVVSKHLPLLAPAARDALKNGRRDAFVALYEQAESLRRTSLLDDQTSIFSTFHAAPADENAAAATLNGFTKPAGAA